ncbi:hypothetical protein CORC01_09108 [Colletotrichum orchidophilum]|uniref:Uncharacterized protein n=1 Tax=Colletotrichum orchidophilum TaxID=1209926 RepID=A0A1G4B270_9PEZI|nr:uncharacterized protein CORC01_09108 [Colletotrichum orchidophilum]OHE95518.1 hypothetical protein CORC01_09108 [Colletotrichum orchidophilum]
MVALFPESQQQVDGLSLRLDTARDLSLGTVVHPPELMSGSIVKGIWTTRDQRPGVTRAPHLIPGDHPSQAVAEMLSTAGGRSQGPGIVVTVRGHRAAQVDVLAEMRAIETSLSLHWAGVGSTESRAVNLSDSQSESAA